MENGALTYPLTLPEDGLVEQNTVLYLAGQSVKVGGRIVVDTKYKEMWIKVKATVTGGAIGGLEEVTFRVDADGVLQPQGTATDKTVNGIDDFTLFPAANPTSSVVRREQATFTWEVTYIGADESNGNNTGSNEAVISDPVLMYTVLSTPLSPWDVGDDPATDDTNQPWVSALEFATSPTKGNASGKNAEGALTEITNFLFRQSEDTNGDGTIDVFGHDLVYSARDGDPEYGYFHPGPLWSVTCRGTCLRHGAML